MKFINDELVRMGIINLYFVKDTYEQFEMTLLKQSTTGGEKVLEGSVGRCAGRAFT